MNIREITKDIFYTGVNDRTSRLFESLWELPYGVSYNSYIVKDTRNVLIDTVELSHARDFLNHIRMVLDGGRLDYLVVNHMEPDHSGSIQAIVDEYPEIKIVGNKHTIAMIKGFYHIDDDDRYMEITNGSTISLGEKTLQFYLTPMVHWPETMMTYCPERKLVFSGDAFGTFGALNGHILDTHMNTDHYIREMYRYYACIVGKYGRFVQKALGMLESVSLDYICSTHGPVWHSRIKEVVELTDHLSAYRSEPGVTIVYGSMYGNTQEVAEAIAMRLAARGVRTIKVHNASVSPMGEIISDAFRYEGLIVGSPTYSMEIFPPVESFMKAMATRDVKNKVFASFGSFTWASAALKKINAYAEQLGWTPLATLEMKQAPNDSVLSQAKAVADAVADNLKCG